MNQIDLKWCQNKISKQSVYEVAKVGPTNPWNFNCMYSYYVFLLGNTIDRKEKEKEEEAGILFGLMNNFF